MSGTEDLPAHPFEKQRLLGQQITQDAFQEMADLPVAIQSRTEQHDRQRQRVKAAQTVLERCKFQYQKGLVNYLNILDGPRTALDAETKLVQTERARLTDMVSLFKALGGGRASSGTPVGI